MAACVYVGALCGGAYLGFEHFRLSDPRGASDAVDYVGMYDGHVSQSVRRYRILVPLLARAVPVKLASHLGSDLERRPAQFAFLVVNSIQMLGAVAFLHAALRRLGFAWSEVVLGGVLFLTTPPAVAAAAVPMVDASTYLASAAVFWAIVVRSSAVLVAALVFGVFAREPAVLIALSAWVSRRFRWYVPLGSAAFALGLWLVFKVAYDRAYPYAFAARTLPTQHLGHVAAVLGQLAQSPLKHAVLLLRSALMSYLGVGALALFGLPLRGQLPAHIRALGPWIALSGLVGVGGNFDRLSYMGFPALLPFALLGVRRIAGGTASPS